MKTAFAYHRYSTLMQKDKYTLEAQRRITKELADKYGAVLIQAYEDEALSGATIDKRPSMVEMLYNLDKIKPDFLIVTDQDRISRSNDFWYIKGKLAASKTSIVTEEDGIIELDNAAKEVLSDMRAAFSKFERAGIRDRVKRGVEQCMRSGNHFGQAPIGYTRKDKQIFINEYSAHIKTIFDLIYTGSSISSVVKYMYDNNYKTQFGGFYSFRNIKSIIQNVTYIGKIKYKGKIYQGNHEPIIDDKTFCEANRKLEARMTGCKTRPAKFLLSGFLYCGNCGQKMTGSYTKNKKYFAKMYRCTGLQYGNCSNSIIAHVDDYVMQAVAKEALKLKSKIKDKLSVVSKPKKIKNSVDVKASVEEKMAKLLNLFLDGSIDEVSYKRKNNELKNMIGQIEEQNKEKQFPSEILELVKNGKIEKLWDNLEFESRREIIEMFVNKVIINKNLIRNAKDWEKRIEIEFKELD